MKKLYTSLAIIAIAGSINAQTVNFEDFNLAPETYWDGSDLSGTLSVVGNDSIYDTTFIFNGVEFQNQFTVSSMGYSYISKGWVFSNKTADTVSGIAGAYYSYAGGGADSTSNYAITFAGTPQSFTVAGGAEMQFSSIKVTNSSYTAYSMLNGDNFAKKFGGPTGDDPDWFLLTIVGYNANGDSVGTVDFYLADYRFSDNSQDYIVKDWTSIDLSGLGAVNRIEFRLSSTDVGNFGMNTPAYVVIDELTPANSTAITENNNSTLTVYPNPTNGIITVEGLSDNGTLSVMDMAGRIVFSQNVNTNIQTIDLSSLPNGFYNIVYSSEGTFTVKRLIKQ